MGKHNHLIGTCWIYWNFR